MCKRIEISEVLSTLGINEIGLLETCIDASSPSLLEYSIKELLKYSNEEYFNKSQIEKTFIIGNIEIFLDYSNNCFIEDNTITKEDYPTLF